VGEERRNDEADEKNCGDAEGKRPNTNTTDEEAQCHDEHEHK